MIELLLADLAIIVGVDLFDEVLHEFLGDGLGVFLVVDVIEHGLDVLEGHQIVVVGVKLVEVFVGELLPQLLLLLTAWLELGGHRQALVGT